MMEVALHHMTCYRRLTRPAAASPSRAMQALRLIWLECKRAHALWIVPLVAAAGVWFALNYIQVNLLFWNQVSANIALTFVLVGSIYSSWGAWLAGRERQHRLTEMTRPVSMSAASRDAMVLGVTIAVALVTYGLVAAIVIGYVSTRATWGGPSLSIIAFGALLTMVFAAMGTTLGRLWPSRIMPLFALIVPILHTALTYSYLKSWDGNRWLSPFAYIMDWRQRPTRILYEVPVGNNDGSLLGGALVALGAVLTAFGLLAALRSRRWTGATVTGVMAVGLVISGRAMAVTGDDASTWMGSEMQPVANPPLACAGEVVETCLHKVYESEVERAAGMVDQLFAPVAGLPGVPQRIEHRADVASTDTVLRFQAEWTFEVLPAQSASYDLLWPVLSQSTSPPEDRLEPLDMPQHVIARWLTLEAGYEYYYASAAAEVPNPWVTDTTAVSEEDRTAYFESMDAYNLEVIAVADHFAALSPDEQRAWLDANWDALRAGDLTLEDLP